MAVHVMTIDRRNPIKWARIHLLAWLVTTLFGAVLGFAFELYHLFKFNFGGWRIAIRILLGEFGHGPSVMFARGLLPETIVGAILCAIAFYIWMLVPPENGR